VARIRKKILVTCSKCNSNYNKRVDSIFNWNGLCRKCSNITTIENKIKGIRKAKYGKCEKCGKESYWIKTSTLCKKCRNENMPHGENHYKWKKDRSTLAKRQERNDMAYKEWRRLVWERDGFKCQLKDDTCLNKIEAHHIVTWSEDESKRYDVSNGITLCKKHHPKIKKQVENSKELFTKIVNSKNI
jgi:hypothetical protein